MYIIYVLYDIRAWGVIILTHLTEDEKRFPVNGVPVS
jgi:hypothetical protein